MKKPYAALPIIFSLIFSLIAMEPTDGQLLIPDARARQTAEISLYNALYKQDNSTAQLLIDMGIGYGRTSRGRYPALHLAVEAGNVDMVDYLLKRGAPVDELDREKRTVFDILETILSSSQLTPKGRAYYETILRACGLSLHFRHMEKMTAHTVPDKIRNRIVELVAHNEGTQAAPKAAKLPIESRANCSRWLSEYLTYNNATYGGAFTATACFVWAYYFLFYASALATKYEA